MDGDAESRAEGEQDWTGLPERRRRFEHVSDDELIDILAELVYELKARKEEAARLISEIPMPEFSSSPPGMGEDHFVRLPRTAGHLPHEATAMTWRIVLRSAEHNHAPLNLEVYDDTIIGWAQDYIVPDLDLTGYDAQAFRVSQQHALLHPTPENLEIVDLLSANGTLVNEMRLKKGEYRTLKDGDVLSFGMLHFKLNIVSQPGSSS